jgi:hypothetical protein
VSRAYIRPTRHWLAPLALASVGFLFAPACGGGGSEDGSKTFQGDGYSYSYPGDWEETTVTAASGDVPSATVVGPGGANSFYVGASLLDISVSEENLDQYSSDLVAETDQLFWQAQGQVTSGPERTTVAGLPALRLEASAVNQDGTQTKSHVILVYDGNTEYFLNCQYTPEGADEMTQGCNQAVDSFAVE